MASGGQRPTSGQESSKYDTREKRECRERLIQHAVECLTKGRETSTCVQRHHVRQAWDEFEQSGEAHLSFKDEEVAQIKDDIGKWELFYDSRTQKKKPSDLRVCYLAGENLMNDLRVFRNCGVLGMNIWAIEKEIKEINKAKKAVKDSSQTIHVHVVHGDFINLMQDPLQDKFDIIYFDACGSLPSEKKETLKAIGYVFLYNKLASPGALITTFSFPPKNTEDYERNCFGELVTGYLKYRLKNTIGHPSDLEEFVDSRSYEENYSDYITYQVIDTAYMYIPALRMLSSNSSYRKSLWQELFVEEKHIFKDVETIKDRHSLSFLLQLWEHMIECKDKPLCKSWVKELFPENPKNKPPIHFIITHLLPLYY